MDRPRRDTRRSPAWSDARRRTRRLESAMVEGFRRPHDLPQCLIVRQRKRPRRRGRGRAARRRSRVRSGRVLPRDIGGRPGRHPAISRVPLTGNPGSEQEQAQREAGKTALHDAHCTKGRGQGKGQTGSDEAAHARAHSLICQKTKDDASVVVGTTLAGPLSQPDAHLRAISAANGDDDATANP